MGGDWIFLGLAGLATVFAGVSKAGFGSGAGFAGAALLALVIDPAAALGLMLPLLMLIDLLTLGPYRKFWNWPIARRIILGSLPGVGLGALFLSAGSADAIRFMLGAMSLVFVATQARGLIGSNRRKARALPDWLGYPVGAVAGFTSTTSHAGGPPVAIYLLSLGLDKTAYQATTVIVFWAINIFKAVLYAGIGVFSGDMLATSALLAPFAVLGAWAGVALHRRVPERAFFAITVVLLTLTGLKLLADAIA